MNYYKVNFSLNQDFKLSITEIENMIPYEREIWLYMILNRVEEQKKQQSNG